MMMSYCFAVQSVGAKRRHSQEWAKMFKVKENLKPQTGTSLTVGEK